MTSHNYHVIILNRYKFVFINLVLQGFSIALPYNLIVISDRFRKVG